MPMSDYLQLCLDLLEGLNDRGLLQGMGELMDEEMKTFVRTKLRTETIGLMKLYREFPIYS